MPKNYCPKCKEKGKWFVKIISYDKGVKCSVCDWKAEKPKAPPPTRKAKQKCRIYNFCEHSDQIGISYLKCLGCQNDSNFASKDKNSKTLIDILWRELKSKFKSWCDEYEHDFDTEWQEYQIKLIKESQE